MKRPACASVPPSARTWKGTTGSSMNSETNTVKENIHMVMNGPVNSGSLEEDAVIGEPRSLLARIIHQES